MGTMVGVVLGIGIVLLIAYADTTVHSPDELEKAGFTVLTAVAPIMRARPNQVKQQRAGLAASRLSPHLIAETDPKSTIAESYRSLRTALQFASIEEPSKLLLVTSSIPQEGKSTTSANLAIVMAHSGA